jgi:hypothetical protein
MAGVSPNYTTSGRLAAALEGALEVLGWGLVGLANAAFVGALSGANSTSGRAQHHFADLGQFALLAVVFGVIRALAFLTVERLPQRRYMRYLIGAFAFAPLGSWAVRADLTNFAERAELPAWMPLPAIAGLTLAVAYLVLSIGAQRLLPRLPRFTGLIGAVALLTATNLLVSADYLGPRVLLVALAARLAALEVGRHVRQRNSVQLAFGAAGCLVLLAAARLGMPPSAATWQHVFQVPGAIAPELFGFALEPKGREKSVWVPPESADWFRDQSAGPARPPSRAIPLPPNTVVVILTVDALRADVLATNAHDSQLPVMAALRERSIRFTHARSPSPSTLTTTMAMLTSRYYSQTYWSGGGKRSLPTEDRSLRWTKLLSDHGVRTAHVLALHGLRAANGVGVGFDVERMTRKNYGPARDVATLVIEEVQRMAEGPGVVYAHFVDSHAPYNLGGTKGTQFERYLKELSLVDTAIGRILDALRKPGLRDRTVLVLSADHGEAFGEHGKKYHASTVYEELLRVPLFFQLPGLPPRSIDTDVSLVDIGPTLLDCFGLAVPASFMGESLLPLMAGKPVTLTRPIVADAGRRIQAMIFPDGKKAIRDLTRNTVEVYDLSNDPSELENLADAEDTPAEHYSAALAHFFDVHTLRRSGWKPPWRKF